MLEPSDNAVRGILTQLIAELGYSPDLHHIARRAKMDVDSVEKALQRLHNAHALLLHPNSLQPWVVHPFALTAGSCWVQTAQGGYWANCLYCGFGIAAALHCDAEISTRIGGEAEPVRYQICNGIPLNTEDIFHLSIPPAHWWDNVIAACASFQPFHSEKDVEAWCARHAMPKGAIMSIPKLWKFARDWYGNYLKHPWKKRTTEEARALFEKHGLISEFWQIS